MGDLKKPAADQKATLVRYIMEPQNVEKYRFLYEGPTKTNAGWTIRDDVFITTGERHGGLTTNYGGFRNRGFGPELPIGHLLGDYHEEPVLLVKVAFGGCSLSKDMRPPSSGGTTGEKYPQIVQAVKDAIEKLREIVPSYSKDAAITVETRDFYRPQDPFGGNKQGIHWHGNGESYWLVGEAMGRAMLSLLPAKTAKP